MSMKQQIMNSPAFQDFLRRVQEHLEEHLPDSSQLKKTLQVERTQLDEQCRGWRMTLGNPQLAYDVRAAVEADMSKALHRIREIDATLKQAAAMDVQQQAAVDPEAVAERIVQLDKILAGDNASAANLMLAQHIDAIVCSPEGQVTVRMCKLGALGDPQDLPPIGSFGDVTVDDSAAETTHRGRRRNRRDVGISMADEEAEAANDFAVDPLRFRGLGPEWFTTDVFQIPRKLSWSEENARAVADYRLTEHATMEQTAEHFGKTVPTIRRALRYAKEQFGIGAFGKQVSQPRRRFWPRDNAMAVAEFFSQPGATMKAAQAHFGKSQPWISKARKIAAQDQSEMETDDAA